MTADQAKYILQAYRAGQDITDCPEMVEAVRLMRSNRDLQAWYDNELLFDQALSAKLANIEVPEHLGQSILASVEPKANLVVDFPWWKQFSPLGAVASLILVIGLSILPTRHADYPEVATSIEHLQSFAADSLKTNTGFNARSTEWKTLVSYLNENDTPAPTSLPGKMDSMPSVGCMTLQYNHKPVGVICFGKNSKSHLFVIDSKDFPEMPITTSPLVKENAFASSIYWSGEDRHYLLVSNDPEELRQFVSF